jgi:hypothetical protein
MLPKRETMVEIETRSKRYGRELAAPRKKIPWVGISSLNRREFAERIIVTLENVKGKAGFFCSFCMLRLKTALGCYTLCVLSIFNSMADVFRYS